MILPVPVTARHIEMGKPGEACDCPVWHAIAEALREHLPGVAQRLIDGLTVSLRHITLTQDGARWLDTPYDAGVFIARYDNADPVAPFSFELAIPDDLIGAAA